MSHETGARSILSKVLFVGGIIIILVLLAWAILNFVPAIFSSLANVGSSFNKIIKTGDGDITVMVNNSDLSTGERFSTYWEYTPTEAGTYSISHDCANGINFDIHIGQDTRRLICNVPLTLPTNMVNVEMTAYNSVVDSFVDVPLNVYYTVQGETSPKYSGKTSVTVKNTGATTGPNAGNLSNATITSQSAPTQTQPTTTTQPQTQPMSVVHTPTAVYTPSGRPDLSISNVYSYPNQSTLQFDVYNIGSGNSGSWQFSYTDPSMGNKVQYSPLQVSLGPGQGMRFTLSFSGQEKNTEVVALMIDPANTIYENSESNNSTYANVTGRGTGSTNNTGGSSSGDYDSRDDADLAFDSLEVGRLSGNRFSEDDKADEGDDVAIQFEVRNRGGESTGSWRFEVTNLPFDDDDQYRSPSQASLRPGEIRIVTLEFENIDEGDYSIRVELDSSDDVDEESENNNVKSVGLEVEN